MSWNKWDGGGKKNWQGGQNNWHGGDEHSTSSWNDGWQNGGNGAEEGNQWPSAGNRDGGWGGEWQQGAGNGGQNTAKNDWSGGASWAAGELAWEDTDWNQVGQNLNQQIEWSGVKLVTVEKNFYYECPSVAARTAQEDDQIRKAKNIEILLSPVSSPKPITTFDEAALPDWLLRQFHNDSSFAEPTPIQVQVWPAALQGLDLIGIAETGSGKTLAYVVPMIIHILAQEEVKAKEGPVGCVLCPTRELADQIHKVVTRFGQVSALSSICLYGGVPVQEQGYELQEKKDVVVATPGRFIQMLNDGWTNLNRVTFVVLDEADEMLAKGFEQQVKLILSQIRPDRQMLMFSATWPESVQEFANYLCTSGSQPMLIRVGGHSLAAGSTIRQKVLYIAPEVNKFEKLYEALKKTSCIFRGCQEKCLVFCRTKHGVDELVLNLEQAGVDALGMHSDKSQQDRMAALCQFRDGQLSILVATNCLGRGHDIPRVKFVINYDAPDSVESYIHRVGRTGRAGAFGYSMTFVTDKDLKIMPGIVEILKRNDQPVAENILELAQQQTVMAAETETKDNDTGYAWDDGTGGT